MGSNESHFNVSVGSDGQSHKTVSTNHNHSQHLQNNKKADGRNGMATAMLRGVTAAKLVSPVSRTRSPQVDQTLFYITSHI